MAKKPNIFIRILSFLVFVILLPVFLIWWIVRACVKHAKYKKWKREGETGRKLILSADITTIDLMEGYEFEDYLKCLFFYLGYAVEVTQKSRDYGADLILIKDGIKTVVQAKRFNKTVGSKAVAEVVGAMKHYGANEGWVVTNSTFSTQAETLARENMVRLIDRDELMELSREVCENLRIDNSAGQVALSAAYNGGGVTGDSFRI